MATGILSLGLASAGYTDLSLAALAAAAVLWSLLAVSFLADLGRGGHRWASPPDAPPALSAVAATTVLGTRLCLLGWHTESVILLALALAAWPAPVVEELRRGRRRLPGASFLVCVATQGLAVLAGALANATGSAALAWAAFAAFCLGTVLYAEVLVRFDPRQLRIGAGDQWIAAGAAAISALAASGLTASAAFTGTLHTALRTAALALMALDLAGYMIMVVAEVHWPRLRYDVRRWATVFPLGMTATACMSVAIATGVGWLHVLGVVLLWVAIAAWLSLLADVAVLTERKGAAHYRSAARRR